MVQESSGSPDIPASQRLIELEYASMEDRRLRSQLRNVSELELQACQFCSEPHEMQWQLVDSILAQDTCSVAEIALDRSSEHAAGYCYTHSSCDASRQQADIGLRCQHLCTQ